VGAKRLVESVIWGRGLAENVRIPSNGGLKIAQIFRRMIFERSLVAKKAAATTTVVEKLIYSYFSFIKW